MSVLVDVDAYAMKICGRWQKDIDDLTAADHGSHEEYRSKWSWIWSELIISAMLAFTNQCYEYNQIQALTRMFIIWAVGCCICQMFFVEMRILQIYVLNMGPFERIAANNRYRLHIHLEFAVCLVMCRFHNRPTFSPPFPPPVPCLLLWVSI